MSNVIPFRKAIGGVFIHEDTERYCLQIELSNDFAITLTYLKTGQKPCLTIWQGNGELDYGAWDIESFREFAEVACGRKSLADMRV